MTIDEPAASYGLFQVAFAALNQGLANSLISFLAPTNEHLAEHLVAPMTFSRRLEALQALAKTLDRESDYVQHFRAALDSAKEVSEWRNARIHARVEFSDGIRPVLMGKDGKPIEIDVESCWEKIRQSTLTLSELDAYTHRLVSNAKIMDEMMNAEPEQS